MWYYTKNGILNVKSAYHLARSLTKMENGNEESSSLASLKSFWNRLWRLLIPQKIKVFLWRACSGILPTGQNLHDRIKGQNITCIYCGCEKETDRHIFLDCEFAQEVWRSLDLIRLMEVTQVSNYKEWLARIMETEEEAVAEIAAVVTWLLWKSRNKRLFAGKQRDASRIGNYAATYILEFKNQQQDRKSVQQQTSSSWTTPCEGILKINIDGAYTTSCAGIGAVVRNHSGQVEALMAERIEDALNAEHVECLAILKTLQFAKEYGITHLIIEGDALGVVQRINKKEPDLSTLGNLINCCTQLMSEFNFVQVRYVNRKLNKPAHILAHKAMTLAGNHVWLVDFPNDVLQAVKADIS